MLDNSILVASPIGEKYGRGTRRDEHLAHETPSSAMIRLR